MEENINIFSIEDYENSYEIYNKKYEYYLSAIDKLSKIKAVIEKYLNEKLETIYLKDDYSISSLIEDNYMKLILFLKEEMTTSVKRYLTIINELLKNLSNVKESIKSNMKTYSEYFNIRNNFNIKFDELNTLQIKYYNSAEKAESFTLNFLGRKIHDKKTEDNEFDRKKKIQNNCKEDKVKYITKLSEVNVLIDSLNKKERLLFNINKNIEICCYDNYLSAIVLIYQFIDINPEYTEKKSKIKKQIFEISNKKGEINTFKYKERNKIEFIQYESKFDFNNCYDTTQMGLYIMVGEEMKKIIGEYIEDKLNECRDKLELNAKIKIILNLDEKVSEKEEKIIYSLLDIDKGRKIFVNNLTLLRTNGNLQKSKKFCEFIGKALNKLLDFERNNNDFSYIKSCLILSETFYYLDSNNNKIYISELLKSNKWIKTPNFWRTLIEKFLDIELSKSNVNNSNKKMLFFSQIVIYVKNMKDFNIDNRIIIKIVDEISQKYEYLEIKNDKSLFFIITNDPKEIEILRKEYQDNPNLENQLYQEDDNLKE